MAQDPYSVLASRDLGYGPMAQDPRSLLGYTESSIAKQRSLLGRALQYWITHPDQAEIQYWQYWICYVRALARDRKPSFYS